MKVLVTGGRGQLGRALVETAPEGHQVVAVDRSTLDICDAGAIRHAIAAHAPELIVNTAAYTAVDKAESDVEAAFAANRDAPGELARQARASGARLIQLSTDFVFDGQGSSPYRPDHPVAPIGIYGASKAAGEAAVTAALPDALILRTSWVYAAHGANFMLSMLRLMRSQPGLRVVADQVGTPTHAFSLARAIWALDAAGARGIHHYSDAGVASWYDFAVAIQEEALAAGLLDDAVPVRPVRTVDFPTPARRPAYSVLDKTGSYELLGQPAAHWRVELRAALAILRDSK